MWFHPISALVDDEDDFVVNDLLAKVSSRTAGWRAKSQRQPIVSFRCFKQSIGSIDTDFYASSIF